MSLELSDNTYGELLSIEWNRIPNFRYMIKYKFSEDNYTFLITDLKSIYGEQLNSQDIEQRFQDINPFAEMRSKSILKYVRQSLENSLQSEGAELSVEHTDPNLTVKLQFSVEKVVFEFSLKPTLLSAKSYQALLFAPLLFTAHEMQRENAALKKELEALKKDRGSVLNKKTTLDQEGRGTDFELYLFEVFMNLQNAMKDVSFKVQADHKVNLESSPSKGQTTSTQKLNGTAESQPSTANIKFENLEEGGSLKTAIKHVLPKKEPQVPSKKKKTLRF